MKRKVIFSPEAKDDLFALYAYISEQAGPQRAIGYVGRIERYCLGLDIASERGTRRDDLGPGLRTIGFERRVTIAFHVELTTVTIDRVLYGGRDLDQVFSDAD